MREMGPAVSVLAHSPKGDKSVFKSRRQRTRPAQFLVDYFQNSLLFPSRTWSWRAAWKQPPVSESTSHK